MVLVQFSDLMRSNLRVRRNSDPHYVAKVHLIM